MLLLEQYCDPVTVSYDGFNITWNETLVGITVVAPCTGPGLSGQLHLHESRCISIYISIVIYQVM